MRIIQLLPQSRARARTLTEQARDAYAALGKAHKKELAEVDTRLTTHRAPPNTARD